MQESGPNGSFAQVTNQCRAHCSLQRSLCLLDSGSCDPLKSSHYTLKEICVISIMCWQCRALSSATCSLKLTELSKTLHQQQSLQWLKHPYSPQESFVTSAFPLLNHYKQLGNHPIITDTSVPCTGFPLNPHCLLQATESLCSWKMGLCQNCNMNRRVLDSDLFSL